MMTTGDGSARAPGDPSAPGGTPQPAPPEVPQAGRPEPRPWLERIGLALIAVVMGGLLTVMAVVAWVGGEWILAAMSASGAVLTFGVGGVTLVRG